LTYVVPCNQYASEYASESLIIKHPNQFKILLPKDPSILVISSLCRRIAMLK
jgi:hypothetical protein